MTEMPDRFFIEEDDKEIYDNLKSSNTPIGKYQKLENKDVFMLAVCYGFAYGLRKPLIKKTGYVRPIYFKEKELNVLYSIAFDEEKNLEVYSDFKKVYVIIEEYANGGIHILKDRVESGEFGTFEKRFEEKLVDLYKKQIDNLVEIKEKLRSLVSENI